MTTNGNTIEMESSRNGENHGSSAESSLTGQRTNSTISKGYIKFRQKQANEERETRTDGPILIVVEPNAGNGFDEKEYSWYQTLHKVVIKIPLSPLKQSSKDVKVGIKHNKLRVKLKKKTLIFDKITQNEAKDGDKNLWFSDFTKTDIIITLTKKEKNMWRQVDSNGVPIDIERVNPFGMPTSQFILIDAKDELTDEIIAEKITFFNDFPKKANCLLSLHGSITMNDTFSLEKLKHHLSLFVEMSEDILIVSDGVNTDTAVSKQIGEIIKDFEELDRAHINILAIRPTQDLQPTTTTSDVIYVDDDGDNQYHRWFIFVDCDNAHIEHYRLQIEKSLAKALEACALMFCLGGDTTLLNLMSSYIEKDIQVIILMDTGGLSEVFKVTQDNKNQDGIDEDCKRKLDNFMRSKNRKIFESGLIPKETTSFDKLVCISMCVILCGDNRESDANYVNLILPLALRLSVKITPFVRAKFLVRKLCKRRIGQAPPPIVKTIEFLSKEHVCPLSAYGFRNLSETFYLMHYAVYKLKKKVKAEENLLAIIESEEKRISSTKSQKSAIREDKNVYNQLKKLTNFVFVEKSEFKIIDIYQELFIWSLMCNQQESAVVLCRASQDILANCLFAHGLLSRMSLKTDGNRHREDYRQNARKFKTWSVVVIRKYEETEGRSLHKTTVDVRELASSVIMNKLKQWNGKSYLDIAIESENKDFVAIAFEMCKAHVDQMWMGTLSTDNSTLTCCVCIAIPLLIFPLIQVRKEREQEERNGEEREVRGEQGEDTGLVTYTDKKCKPFCYKLHKFYTSPFIKHINHAISYCAFLLLFTYLITVELTLEFSWLEIIITFWVCSFCTEDIMQLMDTTFKMYWNNGWNKMDVASIVLFAAGLTAHIMSKTMELNGLDATRICYAVSLLLYYLRVLQFFSFQKTLGPRLLMIYLMLQELFVFLSILSVFVISYSIAAYSVANPNSKLERKFIWDVLRPGIWNIYGEFFLDEIERQQDCTFNQTESNITMIQQCPTAVSMYFRSILMAVYYTITNILLLNLLIAVFNKRIDEVSNESVVIWKWQCIVLMREYVKKPPVIHPFIPLFYVWNKLLSIFRNHCCGCCQSERTKQERNPGDKFYRWVRGLKGYDQHFMTTNKNKQLTERVENIPEQPMNLRTETESIKTQINEINVEISNVQKEIKTQITKETEAIRLQMEAKMKEILEAVQRISKNVGETDEILPKDDKKIQEII